MVDRRLLAGGAALVAAGLLGLAFAQPHAADGAAPPLAVRAVTIGSAANTANPAAARFAATLRYDREANLAFRLPGQITALSPHPGDTLAAGATVARLAPTAYAAAEAMRAADAARSQRDADRITSLVGDGATSPAAAAAARDAARASAAGLAAARYDLASTRLQAPFPALVLARLAEPGETVAPGQVVVRVADRTSPLLAIADVPAPLAARLRRGAPAQVWPDGASAPVRAQVWRVGAGAEARTGLVAVELRLTGPAPFASGSPAAVAFAPASSPSPTPNQHIPAEALIDAQGNSASVWVIDGGGRARRQRLRFFGFDDRDALVAGLPAGARVITSGAGFVGEGQTVTVIGA